MMLMAMPEVNPSTTGWGMYSISLPKRSQPISTSSTPAIMPAIITSGTVEGGQRDGREHRNQGRRGAGDLEARAAENGDERTRDDEVSRP